MNRISGNLTAIVLGASLLLCAGSAHAGVVYTDETAFNTAVAGLGLTSLWSEDFESFASGAVADPLLIGGGLAEVVDSGSPLISTLGGTDNFWLQQGGAASNAEMRGPANTALGVRAVRFDFANQVVQTISYFTTTGTDTSPSYAIANVSLSNFAGWIGSGSETVQSLQFNQTQGIALDNVEGFGAHTPEPGTFLLFGLGAAGLFFAHRRRRNKSAA